MFSITEIHRGDTEIHRVLVLIFKFDLVNN